MNAQERVISHTSEQHAETRNRKVRLHHAAFIAFIAAIAAVTTTVVMIAGSEPAHACLLPGIPC
ncbi:MAG: hypothetical protein OXC15_16510 [Rhodospirillaceae bacterium]|nr:hypothetical protein [Rhodospirillaceae bacterium]